jgi:two-component system chemotaxis response regulator CheY
MNKTIMIVDDAMIMRKKLSTLCSELGFEVLCTAKTGREAIDMYTKYSPDLVTMDITMPDMNGIEAVKQIVAKYPNANIIMSSSHKDTRTIKEALIYGAKGYIVKPITKEKLQNEISKLNSNAITDNNDCLDD